MTTIIEGERAPQQLAQEMREASRGSFPLSPATMTGHSIVSRLYSYYRRDTFLDKSIPDIFGIVTPDPPRLQLPPGHRTMDVDALNRSVWQDFLDTLFARKPYVDPTLEIRSLIGVNASSDSMNFADRLQGRRSRIAISGNSAPSLLRAFLYEHEFPEKNEFFSWLFEEMRFEVAAAEHLGFSEDWSKSLQTLINTWNRQFPGNPFVVSD